MTDPTVAPLTTSRLADLDDLMSTTELTRRCHCTYFLLSGRERTDVWRAGAAPARFEECVRAEPAPLGVIAYHDGRAAGWCATGPRARYPRVLRSPLWRSRDLDEDEDVWAVVCFYVRSAARHNGLMTHLLQGAVALARAHGAKAIEGLPRSEGEPVDAASTFVGFERVFLDCGFAAAGRPSPQRTLMRLEL